MPSLDYRYRQKIRYNPYIFTVERKKEVIRNFSLPSSILFFEEQNRHFIHIV